MAVDKGTIIVLLPADDDQAARLSTQDPPHVTVAVLDQEAALDEDTTRQVSQHLQSVADSIEPLSADVVTRGRLGDDGADVLHLLSGGLDTLYEAVMSDETVQSLNAQNNDYEQWLPHLTLGYPDEPALDDADDRDGTPDTITLDRVALLVGDQRHVFDLGATAMADDETDGSTPIPFHGIVAPEGVETGDGRRFDAGSITWVDPPMPLLFQYRNEEGHRGSSVVGRIDKVWREDGLVKASGVFVNAPDADLAIQLVAQRALRGVSIDADDATMSLSEDSKGRPLTAFESIRMRAATLVSIPAFAEAYIALGEAPEDDMHEDTPALTAAASIDEGSWDGDASNYTDEQWYRACLIHLSDDKSNKSDHKLPIYTPSGKLSRAGVHAAAARINQVDAPAEKISRAKARLRSAYKQLDEDPPEVIQATADTEEFAPGTHDGPGWLTHPVDTERLAHYWTHGPGAARIGWGIPGDFYRCELQLSPYIKPNHLAGYCANRHKEALGVWPGQEHASAAPTDTERAEPMTLIASTEPTFPPRAWFEDPSLDGPTPLVVTEDGQVFGHLATWDTCHVGFADQCVQAPHSTHGYAYFHTGTMATSDGEVAVGQITLGTGHAADGPATPAMAHYDDTGSAVADVRVGEDEHGIWFAGALRPGVDEEQRHTLRAASLSGDWRTIGGNLELIAALAVNVPGFPVPRTSMAASGGKVTTLVASGIVQRSHDSIPDEAIERIVQTVLDTQEQRRVEAQRQEQLEQIRERQGLTPQALLASIKTKQGL